MSYYKKLDLTIFDLLKNKERRALKVLLLCLRREGIRVPRDIWRVLLHYLKPEIQLNPPSLLKKNSEVTKTEFLNVLRYSFTSMEYASKTNPCRFGSFSYKITTEDPNTFMIFSDVRSLCRSNTDNKIFHIPYYSDVLVGIINPHSSFTSNGVNLLIGNKVIHFEPNIKQVWLKTDADELYSIDVFFLKFILLEYPVGERYVVTDESVPGITLMYGTCQFKILKRGTKGYSFAGINYANSYKQIER